jgi:hypothetical protein
LFDAAELGMDFRVCSFVLRVCCFVLAFLLDEGFASCWDFYLGEMVELVDESFGLVFLFGF